MRFPASWLREFVPAAPQGEALARLLTMGGLEVEEAAAHETFEGVRVARILTAERHPAADRLRVCTVDAGEGAPRTIVCGAPNAAAGLLVPCALPGAKLPGGVNIGIATMRGVRSEGMLCSGRELRIADDADGLLVLDAGLEPGTDLRAALGLDEEVLEVKATPNRGDCLSVLGIAREVAALAPCALERPAIAAIPASAGAGAELHLPVQVRASELCGRFTGRVVRGLDPTRPTPAWMKRRLEACGQRSISALVDISNFVMLECGQPSHVFDLARVLGPIEVRWAREGERLELLNGQSVTLDPGFGVVADARGALAIAGIMGGQASAVCEATTDVYLEAAFWWPDAIQGRSRRLNFATDAGHRFERGVDFTGTVPAIERLTALLLEVCGTPATRVGRVDDQALGLPVRSPVRVRVARLVRILGIEVGAGAVRDAFARLGLSCEAAGEGEFLVTPPGHRFDISIEEDLIEEVARIVGYESIPALPPLARQSMRCPPEGRRDAHWLRAALARSGYQELVNFSFVAAEWEDRFSSAPQARVALLNPIASQYAVMRTTLLPGLLANLRYNLNRQSARVRTFELGRVFGRDTMVADGPSQVAGIAQPLRIAALAFGAADAEQWGVATREVDFFDIKGDLEALIAPLEAQFRAPVQGQAHPGLHPGRSACVIVAGKPAGWIGELHPALAQAFELPHAPVLFEIDIEGLLAIGLPDVREVPRFPALVRDIAVWIDSGVAAGEVLSDLRNLARSDGALSSVREMGLFDVFHPSVGSAGAAVGSGTESGASGLKIKEKSLAFRMVLQDTGRSLAESDADAARARILDHLVARWGARAR
jgi:phenylalanyl-tRNA synthetase beta chain